MRKILLLTLLAMSALIATPAEACSCDARTLPEEVAATPLIFSGKVVKLEVIKTDRGVNTVEVTVERERVFKGDVGKTVVFTTSDGCCYCASWFDIARTYLFFARESEGRLTTNTCTRTKLLAQAKDEVQYLEQAALSASARD
jgi:hypothetical protein